MANAIFQNLKDGIATQTTTSSDIIGSCLSQAEKNALLNELADWGTPNNGGGNLSGVVTSVGLVTSIANATITSAMIVGTLTNKIVNGVTLSTAGPATDFLNKTGVYSAPPGGTVTSASVVTANGVSGTVATPTTTPAITLTLGAITPASVASVGAISGTTFQATGMVSLEGGLKAIPQILSGNGAVSAVNLTTTVTTIENTGTANTTTTLAAGTNGQYKEIAFIVDGGFDAVVTVTNPAWGGAGTITMGEAGDTIALRYLGSLWVVISNNGSVLA